MSYDIFFVRRDPGQTFEDALDGLEDSFESGDPGPLTEDDLEHWDACCRWPARSSATVEVDPRRRGDPGADRPATGIGVTLLITGRSRSTSRTRRAGTTTSSS